MKIKVDVGLASLAKFGEEVCGDTTQLIRTKESTIAILSDGLGSGIKASILSILSTKIAARLLKSNISLEQVFATIADTLPICKVRGLAYSTLSILKIRTDGEAHLIEYDNPSLMFIRDNELLSIKKRQKKIAGKDIQEAFFKLNIDDLLILNSDGVINAGVGGLFQLGLGKNRLLKNILSRNLNKEKVQVIADKIIELTEACYLSQPGDDSTSLVLKIREPRAVVILTGPPKNKALDKKIVASFLEFKDCKKIVCGGTTGNLVAREMNKEIKTGLNYVDPSVPPMAFIEGIDLVTEGVLTLNKCLEKIDFFAQSKKLHDFGDGASILAKTLLEADEITFIVGKMVNPANEELMQSLQLKSRPEVIGQIVKQLEKMGKGIKIESC